MSQDLLVAVTGKKHGLAWNGESGSGRNPNDSRYAPSLFTLLVPPLASEHLPN
jgi:hypothetical protein